MKYIEIIKIENKSIQTTKLPKREHIFDAGADVFAPYNWNLPPGGTEKFPLGYGLKIPENFMGVMYPRGSLAVNGIYVSPNPIDTDYKGEVHAILTNMGRDSYYIAEGTKIAQLVILPVEICGFITEDGENAPIPQTRRGLNAFGSTGV